MGLFKSLENCRKYYFLFCKVCSASSINKTINCQECCISNICNTHGCGEPGKYQHILYAFFKRVYPLSI